MAARKAPAKAPAKKRTHKPLAKRTSPARTKGGAAPRASGQRSKAGWIAALVAAVLVFIIRAFVRILPGRERLAAWWATPALRRALIICVASLGVWLAVGSMESSLAESPNFQIDPTNIELQDAPISWVNTPEARAFVLERVQADLKTSLRGAGLNQTSAFDAGLVGACADALSDNGWVSRVVSIQRHFPTEAESAKLALSLDIRRPVLKVVVGNQLFLVDRESIVLPLALALPEPQTGSPERVIFESLTSDIRLIRGIIGNAPVPGQKWRNQQVAAALSIEETLRNSPSAKVQDFIALIDHINVGDVGTHFLANNEVAYAAFGGLVLHIRGSGTQIVWGKAPCHSSMLEKPIAEKIKQLEIILERDPTLNSMPKYELSALG